MDPATSRRNETIPTKSPLSAFLSDLIQERFGSIRTNGKIVVDNALSHAPLRSMRKNSDVFDSDSIARTSSSSSSSRWDPNVLPASTERNSVSSGNGHRKNHGPESTLVGSSYGIPTVPVRRDSPGKWRTKQALFGTTAKKDKLSTQLFHGSDDIFEASLGENSILPPPFPIRRVSLQPPDFIPSNSEPNLAQEREESKVRRPFTKDASKPRDLFPLQFPIRQVTLSSPDFFPSRSEPNLETRSHKKSKDASDEKGDMNRETKKKKKTKNQSSKTKKTKKSRRKVEEKTKKKSSFPHPQKSELLPSKLSKPRSPSTPTNKKSDHGSKMTDVARLCHRSTVLPRRSRPPVPKSILKGLGRNQMSSLKLNLVPPEGRSLVSALTSLPSSAVTSTKQKKSMNLANHRSLSETLLSCDRDTIESGSTTLLSSSTRGSKQLHQDRKRSPPVRPIRQLSRALIEL